MSVETHTVSVVVPVYRGENTLRPLVEELLELSGENITPDGHRYRVIEVVLVYDHGPDRSAATMRALACDFPIVKPVWLARNSGQHAATAAGIASSGGQWVATLDEDGQHVPSDLALMLDAALRNRTYLVYGRPTDGAPHSLWRNSSSKAAKSIASLVAGTDVSQFSSFRLIEGSRARSITAYVGPHTYLDMALMWAIGASCRCATTKRAEWRHESGYSVPALVGHFWTLVLSSGTRPLRVVSLVGFVSAMFGFATAAVVVARKLTSDYKAPGWASTVASQLLMGGLILVSLGIVAEYIGELLRSAQGKPLYIILQDPADGPIGDSAV